MKKVKNEKLNIDENIIIIIATKYLAKIMTIIIQEFSVAYHE